jgi:hypothetical protein
MPSLPDLIRQSILFVKSLSKAMDTRVKPAYDDLIAEAPHNHFFHVKNT